MKRRVVFVLMILICMVSLPVMARQTQEYDQALRQFQQRNYQEAYSAFSRLSGFEDSDLMAVYSFAAALVEQGEYADALTVYDSLGTFKMTDWYISYTRARQLETQGYDLEAIRAYRSMGGFSDSAQRRETLLAAVYQRAEKLATDKKYIAARDTFKSIHYYRDSAKLAVDCQTAYDEALYLQAVELEKAGDYRAAYDIYRWIPHYRDSQARAAECDYQYKDTIYTAAEALAADGHFLKARDKFLEIPTHRDSQARAKDCEYQHKDTIYAAAEALEAEGHYLEARDKFLEIPNHRDSQSRAKDCEYQHKDTIYAAAETLEAEGHFLEARDKFLEIPNHRDSQARAAECEYQYKDTIYAAAEALAAEGHFLEARDKFLEIPNHRDSQAKAKDSIIPAQYQQAVQHEKQKAYDEAIAIYLALGTYQDSASRIEACLESKRGLTYQNAVKLFEANDFVRAAPLFEQLGAYAEAQEYLDKCHQAYHAPQYAEALAAQEAGDIGRAYSLFDSLGSYGHSIAKAEAIHDEAMYLSSMELMEQEHWSEAITAFEASNHYPGSASQIALCRQMITYDTANTNLNAGYFKLAEALFKDIQVLDSAQKAQYARDSINYYEARKFEDKQAYGDAIKLYAQIPGYADSEARLMACLDAEKALTYLKASTLAKEGSYEQVIPLFRALGDYADSKAQLEASENAVFLSMYVQAQQLEGRGRYQEALEQYRLISFFRDSASRAQACEDALHGEAYKQAQALVQSGDYAGASALFLSLGEYKDSAQQAAFNQNMVQYEAAKALFDQGKWLDAYSVFQTISSFQDAGSLAQDCLTQAYQEAAGFEAKGEHEAAQTAFIALEALGYSDSAQRALFNRHKITYLAAEKLLEDHQLAEAEASFLQLASLGFLDSADRAEETRVLQVLQQARQLLDEGQFMDAYRLFASLPGHSEAAAQALQAKLLHEQSQVEQALTAASQQDYEALGLLLDATTAMEKEAVTLLEAGVLPVIVDLLSTGKQALAAEMTAKLPDKSLLVTAAGEAEANALLTAARLWGLLLPYKADLAQQSLQRITQTDTRDSIPARGLALALLGRPADASMLYAPYQGSLVASASARYIMVNDQGKADQRGMTPKESSAIAKWKDLAAVACGKDFSAGLQHSGKVIFTGTLKNSNNVANWTKITQIEAGDEHLVALRSDGKVMAAGVKDGRLAVSTWTDVIAVAAAGSYTMGLKQDGTVLFAAAEKTRAGTLGSKVASWTGIIGIAAGSDSICFGLQTDGTIVTATNISLSGDDIGTLSNIVALTARKDGTGLLALGVDGSINKVDIQRSVITIQRMYSINKRKAFLYASYVGSGIIGIDAKGQTQTNNNYISQISLPIAQK